MSDVKLSKRAEKVLEWIEHQAVIPDLIRDPVNFTGPRLGGRGDRVTLAIRQQTLADLLGCSRRSIYRALKQLKEQGCLKETGKREKRCKIYEILRHCEKRSDVAIQKNISLSTGSRLGGRDDNMELDPGLRQGDKNPLCTQAKFYLDNCRNVFRYNFPEDFDWEKFFHEATHKIRHIEHQTKFWRLMFDNLYLIQERETGKPSGARINNPDSTLFGVSYPKTPPPDNIDRILRTRPAYR
ncbi:MAG: winged helix-turn-helix domain-containing protein [Deltaproteobacteria bacterium]|nr:winged helix-turn-helix domain-containing protein [Deltaproteobacteria bacterium]